jgi:hypothetical protein
MRKIGSVSALAIAVGGLIQSSNAAVVTECMTITEPGSYVLQNNLPGAGGILSSEDV